MWHATDTQVIWRGQSGMDLKFSNYHMDIMLITRSIIMYLYVSDGRQFIITTADLIQFAEVDLKKLPNIHLYYNYIHNPVYVLLRPWLVQATIKSPTDLYILHFFTFAIHGWYGLCSLKTEH